MNPAKEFKSLFSEYEKECKTLYENYNSVLEPLYKKIIKKRDKLKAEILILCNELYPNSDPQLYQNASDIEITLTCEQLQQLTKDNNMRYNDIEDNKTKFPEVNECVNIYYEKSKLILLVDMFPNKKFPNKPDRKKFKISYQEKHELKYLYKLLKKITKYNTYIIDYHKFIDPVKDNFTIYF
jgi:hypothetical protein